MLAIQACRRRRNTARVGRPVELTQVQHNEGFIDDRAVIVIGFMDEPEFHTSAQETVPDNRSNFPRHANVNIAETRSPASWTSRSFTLLHQRQVPTTGAISHDTPTLPWPEITSLASWTSPSCTQVTKHVENPLRDVKGFAEQKVSWRDVTYEW